VLKPPIPESEAKRLAALRGLGILDSPPEAEFDDIVQIASAVCGVPIALITLVDEHRQWFKAKVGIDATETARDIAFCAHAILDDEVFVVHDAREDERFADNPLVTGGPGVQFYAGAPLTLPSGDRVGTLCLIDAIPRAFTDEMRKTLLALKRQVESQLALRAHAAALARANAAMVALQVQKERLVQFVVHDMKNALSGVSLNAEAIASMVTPGTDVALAAADMVESSAHLGRMVADMLDIGAAELGTPMQFQPKTFPAGALFSDIAKTFATSFRDNELSLVHTGDDVVLRADAYLLRRVLENVVANALRFAPKGSTLSLEAARDGAIARIYVTDEGPGIPKSKREAIFDLYTSGSTAPTNRGLGLAFCRAAMTAQGGRITVDDAPRRGTRFAIEVSAG
jgi:signal transduction histidine kinase